MSFYPTCSVSLWNTDASNLCPCSNPRILIKSACILSQISLLFAFLCQIEIVSNFFLNCKIKPRTSLSFVNYSPMKASSNFSQYWLVKKPFWTLRITLPPYMKLGSSHIGLIPWTNTWNTVCWGISLGRFKCWYICQNYATYFSIH